MDQIQDIKKSGNNFVVLVSNGRSFTVPSLFAQQLVGERDKYFMYAMTAVKHNDQNNLMFSGDRARFTTPTGRFEFCKADFIRILKALGASSLPELKMSVNPAAVEDCEACE